jgi:hypothetical protein
VPSFSVWALYCEIFTRQANVAYELEPSGVGETRKSTPLGCLSDGRERIGTYDPRGIGSNPIQVAGVGFEPTTSR